MFLLANLIEVNIFALKEDVCMSDIKSHANKGRGRPPSSQHGSWWQSVVWWPQHSLGFACGLCSDQHDDTAASSFYEVLSSSW